MSLLEVRDLRASVAGKPILKGVSLSVKRGEVHAVMGPNGSGKSTMGNVLMGSPKCVVSGGSLEFDGRDLLPLAPDERARAGLFIAFQHPVEIQGLKFHSFLKRAAEAVRPGEKVSVLDFRKLLWARGEELGLPRDFDSRDVNHGLSGGEKKRAEVAQLGVLKPSLALLDEIDSGLDVDSVKVAAREVNKWAAENDGAVVLMTHYKRILDYIKPDFVHVMVDGRIVESGDYSLAGRIDAEGYSAIVARTPVLREEGVGKEEFYTSVLKLNKEKALSAGS